MIEQIKPVGYSTIPDLRDCICLQINKKHAQNALVTYKKMFPTYLEDNNIQHIKLIKNDKDHLLLFLCLKQDQEQMIQAFNKEFSQEAEIQDCLVAAQPPIDKVQYKTWNTYWPLNISINLPFPAQLSYDKEQILKLGQKVLQGANQSFDDGFRRNYCILFDPVEGKIMAEGRDGVKRLQKNHQIEHCVMRIMEELGKNLIEISMTQEVTFEGCHYFARDMFLIVYQEPCVMCSMALVHSRVKAVFFIEYNQQLQGGMNEKLQINDMDQLNHRFPVYKISEL